MFVIADRTQETTTTQGTGTLSLLGAVPQFQSFSSGIGNGNSTYYSIIDGNGLAWEIGIGTVGAGTLARSSVLSSSNSNTLVNLSAFGPHVVFCDAPAAAVQLVSSIATNTILANLTGGSAAPTANTLSAILDYSMSSTQGVFLYRGASAWAALGTGTNGQVLTTQGASANPIWVTLGLSSLPTQTNNTILSNISGITATPSANTLTAIIDTISSTQGVILYRNSTVWAALATGTSGYFLQTGGASANPQWALAVTSVATGTGLTGGTITSTGTISLAAIASNNILANITGGSAAPLANTLTAIIDTIGSAQGDILYRGASAWGVLAPSTSGYFLQTGGASANPVWAAVGLGSFATQTNNTILSNISGITATPSANTLTAIIDTIGSAQGDILYRDSSAWLVLAPGTSGQYLKAFGASANVQWASIAYSELPSITSHYILANITGGSTTPSANTLTSVIDAAIDNTQGDILYRSSTVWTNLAPSTAGYFLQTQGASANPVWAAVGLSSFATQGNNTILSNISGISAAPLANTLTATIDSAIGSAQGDILYRNSTAWAVLAPSTSGYFLQTGGASANPAWALAVTSVATGTGLTGGTITSTGTISLAAIASNNILANITGGSAAPLANTLTAIIDTIDNTQGNILYRSATVWTKLSPGTAGYFLQTGGASANPTWAAISSLSSSSLAAQANNTILSNISGGAASPSANTLTTIIDSCIGSTQGDILYRNSTIWAVLAPGTAGQSLVTGGASANPAWTTLGYSNLPAEIQNSLAVATIPGLQPTSSKVMVVPITQNTQVPANFANSQGYSITNATGTFIYTVGYIHSGTPASIGTVTFTGAGSTPTFSTQAFVNLVAGDVLYISTQSSGDGTLADVGITLILLKQ